MGLAPGKLRVRVERVGYHPSEEQEVTLGPGETKPLKFDLQQIPRLARLHVTNAAGVEISVEGKSHKPGAEGHLEIEVSPGKRQVQLDKSGHKALLLTLDFSAGQTSELDVSKQNFARIVKDGFVTFIVNPDTATIEITGGDRGPRTVRPGETTGLPGGRYRFRAHAPGFDDYNDEFEIKDGDTLPPISFELRSRKVEAPKLPTVPSGMAGFENASDWVQGENGYWQNKRTKSARHGQGAGTFSFTTPCKPKTWMFLGDCKTVAYLTNGPSFEITDNKVKRGGKSKSFPKISEEMRVKVIVTLKRTTLEVNGQEVDFIDGDYTKGQFGVRSVEFMKDFRYTPLN
jgi:hypothetical protein